MIMSLFAIETRGLGSAGLHNSNWMPAVTREMGVTIGRFYDFG